ncbi:hypothetical protein J2Z31_005049 [Sinorhizobium kostiense]|uniref:Uncharacterized protein n=1 Tax=Sinorhizobium kostiense TaxID=76747 RepID=A0ABS4R6J7_9HYPH|nr:hypothetical protein [Sinorhizobium kostiense]
MRLALVAQSEFAIEPLTGSNIARYRQNGTADSRLASASVKPMSLSRSALSSPSARRLRLFAARAQ